MVDGASADEYRSGRWPANLTRVVAGMAAGRGLLLPKGAGVMLVGGGRTVFTIACDDAGLMHHGAGGCGP